MILLKINNPDQSALIVLLLFVAYIKCINYNILQICEHK